MTSAAARRLTGSLLVHYETKTLSSQRIKAILRRECGVDCRTVVPPDLDANLERFFQDAGEGLLRAGAGLLVDAALKRAGLSFLSVLL